MRYLPTRTPLLLAFAAVLPASAQVVERWVQRYDRQANQESAPSLAVDASGQVLVAGDAGSDYLQDTLLMKYAGASGVLLWAQHGAQIYGGSPARSPLALDASGNAVITGSSETKFSTAKYASADGAVLWGPVHNEILSDHPHTGASAVTVDRDGHVIVTGTFASHQYIDGDYYTAKYEGTGGTLLWEHFYQGPAGSGDHPVALAADHLGNVIVTGNSCPAGCAMDWFTVKYAASNGAVLWEQRFTGDWDRYEYVTDLAVDATGNVFVTGSGQGDNSTDWYLVKYAAGDGAVLWKLRWAGPAYYGEDFPSALVVDAAGNVIITGISEALNGWKGWRTAKYAAADGALLWERFYYGPGYGDHTPTALDLDAAGNVLVTGATKAAGTAGTLDYYTVKYAVTDGSLLWEQRYNGPGNSLDVATSVAATRDGGAVVTGTSSLGSLYTYTTIHYVPVSTQQPWRAQFFGANANASAAADDADPDHDGLPNLIEWGCGSNPATVSPPPGTPGRDGANFTFRYPRSAAAVTAGALFAVEWSDTLAAGTWQSDGVIETVLSNNGTLKQVLAVLPESSGRRFARLKVTAP